MRLEKLDYGFEVCDGFLYASVGDGVSLWTTTTSYTIPTSGTWYNFAMVWLNNSALYLYVDGLLYVNLTGNKIYYIPKGDVQLLVDEFIEINYFALEDEYLGSITDFPSTTTSITINNKTKNIYDYISGPKKLKDLERKIDEVGLSKQWVNG